MVVFDNLARILREILRQSVFIDEIKEWKLLGQEANGQLTVGWVEKKSNSLADIGYTYIGIFQPKINSVKILCKLDKTPNLIQASVNSSHSIVSFIVKEKNEVDDLEYYKHYIATVKKHENVNHFLSENPQSLGYERRRQIMTNFLETTSTDISKLLIFIHLESITMHILKKGDSDKIITVKIDNITKSFTWAQWDCDIQSLYFIHFRKTLVPNDDEDLIKQDASPTLSCLQFHPNLPHETVLNIPLNLPCTSSINIGCQLYEDNPMPLRIHDCSLDLIVVSHVSGAVYICHHYLYQPVGPPEEESYRKEDTVHFAYSVTLLHHSCIIHSVVHNVPWKLAKIIRPVFALLGNQYLVVYAAGIFTHLLDVGPDHEPDCHIVMDGNLSMVPSDASKLVTIREGNIYPTSFAFKSENLGTVMMDLLTMNLIHFEVAADDLLKCLKAVESVKNRLSILHYFLVHADDIDNVEEALGVLLKNPMDINVSKFFQEILMGGTYNMARKNLPPDAHSLLKLFPMTCLECTGQIVIKVNQMVCVLSQEKLWNTAMMLLSPQQRLIPFNIDMWMKLWNKLIAITEKTRFKPSQVADKLPVLLGYNQPDSCCSTPFSPGPDFISTHIDLNLNQGLNQGGKINAKQSSRVDLPFLEIETCIFSKQEQIITMNLRELSLHLLKSCHQLSPALVHPVATGYVAAQLEISKLLCHLLTKLAGIENEMKTEKGFSLIKILHRREALLLFTYYQRYFHAADILAYPLPQGFTSFFCYLGFTSLSYTDFMMYLQNNVFELQLDVMKKIMQDIDDTTEGTYKKLHLLHLVPRSRAKKILRNWSHEISLMIRSREHALNILSGVQNSHCRGVTHCKRLTHSSKGLAAFPSRDRLSPLDTFLDLLTAKASLTDLDFNLLIDATISSIQDVL